MFDFLKSAEPVSQCTPPKFVPVEVLNEGEQKALVAEYIEKARGLTFLINRCLDSQDVDGAFQHGATLASFLQSESFNPHNYYSLYNVVSEALLNLGFQVSDKNRFSNESVCSQYEIAQYHKGVIQRLYLMITVAPELSSRGYARVLDVLSDIAMMIRQSQNVTHSLFLRYFLLCAFKSHLPDSTSVETERTVHFLLHNFAQMNRMWVRMADTSENAEETNKPASTNINEKILSNKEQRKELSVLVGMNLSRVTSLKNLTPDMYSNVILPFVLKHVDICEDALAQGEILQFIVHAFPADFQIHTIDQLFAVFGKVDQSVPILSIVSQLLSRFLDFDGELIDPTTGKTTFVTIAKNIEELFNSEGNLALINKFKVLEKLLRFALKVNSKDVRNIKNLLKFADFQIDLAIGEEQLTSKEASDALLSFVKTPFEAFNWDSDDETEEAVSPLVILSQIDHLPSLIKRLMPSDRAIIATEICKILINSSITISSMNQFTFILQLTSSIVREGPGSSYFFAMLTLINTGSVESTMSIVQELANVMDTAFTEKAASKAILPIGFKVIRLMHDAEKENLIKLVQFLAQFVKRNAPKNPKSCLQLCIEAARTLNKLEFGEEATQFATTAVDDFYALLRSQCEQKRGNESLTILFNVFLYITNFVVSATSIDFSSSINSQLCSIAAAFSSSDSNSSGGDQSSALEKLKPFQATIACQSFANCANLFWRKDQRMNEEKNVKACLAKACQIAATNSSLSVSLELLYSVLSWAVYFIENGCAIDIKWIHALISLIRKKQGEVEQSGQSIDTVISKTAKNFYISTVKHIQENNLIEGGDEGGDDEEDEAEGEAEDDGDEGEGDEGEGDEGEEDE